MHNLNRMLWPLAAGSLMVCAVLLAGCAIEPAKQSTASTGKGEIIVVDGDVQRAFDDALKAILAQDYATAITLLDSVVQKEQRLTAPYINLALVYRKQGDDKQAEQNLMKALDIDLGDAVANNELGLLYRKQGKFTDARKAYTNALIVHPNYLPVIKNLGILCDLYMRDLQCALEQFEKYLDQVPDDATVKIWIADLKARIGS